jgi:hypothetical protein
LPDEGNVETPFHQALVEGNGVRGDVGHGHIVGELRQHGNSVAREIRRFVLASCLLL